MTQYNLLNLKSANFQIKSLKSGIKKATEVTHQMLLEILIMNIIFRISCY